MTTTAAESPAAGSPKLGWKDWLFLLAAPWMAFWLLKVSFFVQLRYLDPWIYTGAGQVFEKLVDAYGWVYYFLRFPVIFVNRLFCLNGAPDTGFILLRYCLILGAGGALYAMALKQYGRMAAVAGYLFLFCNPLFLRVLNWDLTPFLSVPAALAGAAIWLYAERGSWWRYALAGALFCVSANSHIFTVTAIGCFMFGVIVVHLAMRRPLWPLVAQFLLAAVGFAVVWVAGWWYYRSLVGPLDPLVFWKVSADAMASGSNYAVTHAQPFANWGKIQTYLYVPFLLIAAALILPRPARAGSDYGRRIILLACASYAAFYLFYRFVLGRFVIEEFYYFGHIWALFPLMIPVVVAQAERCGSWRRCWGLVFGGVMIFGSYMLVLENQDRTSWHHILSGSLPVLLGTLLVALVAVVVMRKLAGRNLVCLLGFASFAAAVQLLSILPQCSREVYAVKHQTEQRELFRVVAEYSHLWAKYGEKGLKPLLWYTNSDDFGIDSLGYSVLGSTLQQQWQPGGMPEIGSYELGLLSQPGRRYVFLMAKDRESILRGKQALSDAGLQFTSIEKTWVSAGTLTVYVEVVEFMPFPTS